MGELQEIAQGSNPSYATDLPTAHGDDDDSADQPLANVPAYIDVQDAKSLPDWFNRLPIGTQQILALMSIGFTDVQIARRCSIEVLSVQNCRYNHLTRHKRVLMLSPANRAALQVAVIEAKALQAVDSIDDASLEASPARDRAYVAKALAETADRIASRQQPTSVEFTDMEARLKVRISK